MAREKDEDLVDDASSEEEDSEEKEAPAKPAKKATAKGRNAEPDDDEDEDDEDDEEESPPPAKVAPKKKKAAAAPVEREEKSGGQSLGPVAHLGFVILAAVAVYSFVSVAKEGEMRRRCTPTCILRPNYAGYERKAPNFTLRDTKGHEVSMASYRGKVVVLNFWTKTCGPCMEEMPEIADLAKILKPMSDVAVVTVSTDDTAEEARDTLKSVLRDEPPFPVLMDPDAKIVKGSFGTSLYPETWIIDKDGIIRARFDGAREWSSATVVELVNQIRGGGYCPVQSREGKFVGDSVKLCENLSGG